MDKKSRKSALDRKMEQSYHPDLSEQEENYDSKNGLEGEGGDSTDMSHDESPAEEASEGGSDDVMATINDVGEQLSNIASKLPKAQQQLAAQALAALAQIAQSGAGSTNPLPQKGEVSSDAAGGQMAMNPAM